MAETTQGDRIKAVREARDEALEPFAAAMNQLLPEEEHARSTTVWRWEKNEGSPSFRQGLAIIKLDPMQRGIAWFAGQPIVPPKDRALPHPDAVPKKKGKSA